MGNMWRAGKVKMVGKSLIWDKDVIQVFSLNKKYKYSMVYDLTSCHLNTVEDLTAKYTHD